MRRRLLAVSLVLVVAGCSSHKTDVAQVAPPPLPPAPPSPAPMPQPPNGAAANLTIPLRLADGSYATPNRSVSAAGAVWHLRAALNVAALGCPDAALSVSYNRLLALHRQALARAHAALAREYGDAGTFDVAMTRLYNYFAQPPAQAAFCAEAGQVIQEALAAPDLAAFATVALPRLDRPFVHFYAAYDRYRAELAAWRAAPRLAYDLPAIRRVDAGSPGRSLYADGMIDPRKRL